MAQYWDNLADTYAKIGQADFWLKHRLRILDGISGRVLDGGCGSGDLVRALRHLEVDAFGVDAAAQMVRLAQQKLAEHDFDPQVITQGDLTQLAFRDNSFDVVVTTGVLGTFSAEMQQAALKELTRVAGSELRLLEPFEKRPGLYPARVVGWLFDGQRPLKTSTFEQLGLRAERKWDAVMGVFSFIHCTISE
ncbi:MAG: class I SAM-dependent methyltransferase [Chloroflexi bacterium]|nr:class I SAM-dependent methyltransferase [Chloroflexota bacterium]